MVKRCRPPDSEPMIVQKAVRITATVADRLEATATNLGVDCSGLLRMLVLKYLPVYEREAESIEKGWVASDGKKKSG
jgi:hypothetical protein